MRKLLPLVLSLALSVAGAAQAAEPCRGFARLASDYLRAKADAGEFSGVALIAYDFKPLVRQAYGLANRELNVPARPDSVFQIGSTTKTFTAVAVALLVQDGKLGFDDPIGRYLPNVPAAWRDITVAQLLAHESGLVEYSGVTQSFTALMRVRRTPQEILALIADKPLKFTPGSRYAYTNTDFVLLGLIVEAVGGQPYEIFVRDRILRPSGLTHTGFIEDQALLEGRASGYFKPDGVWANSFYIDPSMLYAAGSMYSTVDDLMIWDRVIHDGDLLQPAIRQRLFTDRGHGYGLGFFVDSVDGHRYVGHGGNLPGFASDFERFDDAPLTFVLLSNTGPAKVEKMTRELASLYFKRCTARR